MKLTATTTMGLESVAARELKNLGFDAHSSAEETGRVHFSGDWADVVRTNIWLRTAGKILIELARFEAADNFDSIFTAIESIPWEEWMPKDAKIFAEARSVRSAITSVPALQRTLKKGIVNRLLRKYGGNLPETGPEYTVELTLRRDTGIITLDTTGRGLHRRGYRTMNVAVPLRETLASALIQLSVWHPDRPLIDPFCASGTIPIEAAMLARRIAPGLSRHFAAENWPVVPIGLWKQERETARAEILPPLKTKIIGSDIDAEALRLASYHAKMAGVADDIIFRQADFRDLADNRLYGCVIGNPPYGDRVGEREEFRSLYESIPAVLSKLPTWSHYLITSWNDFESLIGQKADRRRKLYNSRIECTYFQFLGPKPPAGFFNPANGAEDSASGQNTVRSDESVSAIPEKKNAYDEIPPFQAAAPQAAASQAAFTGLTEKDKRQIEEFGRCLTNRAKHLARYPKRGITCYRLYDRDFPEVPLAVDLFENRWLHLAEYERPDERSASAHRLWLDSLVEKAGEILHIDPENRFLKRRAPQRGKNQYEKFAALGERVEVREGDLTFLCNMTDYLDVGLFLDHRITRSLVRKESAGKHFLNLFCYTGSFTCAAAAGNAADTVSVDLSATYLDWTEANLRRNGFCTAGFTEKHRLIRSDVIAFLRNGLRNRRFDLCVCDPPTYSNSKSLDEDWDVQKRHTELLLLLADRMNPGGVVYFSNNFRRFKLDEEALSGRYTIREISRQTVPEEYRNKKIHRCWRLIRKDV